MGTPQSADRSQADEVSAPQLQYPDEWMPRVRRANRNHELTKEGHYVTRPMAESRLDSLYAVTSSIRDVGRSHSAASWFLWLAVLTIWIAFPPSSCYSQQETGDTTSALDVAENMIPANLNLTELMRGGPNAWTSPEGLKSSIQVMLILTVLSLAPAILLMTTSFIRVAVVLALLKQALGTPQLPPSQVMTSIALFITVLIMSPVWKQVYNDAIVPYTSENQEISLEQAWEKGVRPVRQFMSKQIAIAGNSDDVWLFYEYVATSEATPVPQTYDDVPLHVLIPAFMLSELKTSFLIGFNIYLPFLILDIVVASVTLSMGMLMLPPVMISLPFKLMLFVLVDGWTLVVGMLLQSFTGAG